jgi:hypothetical protein
VDAAAERSILAALERACGRAPVLIRSGGSIPVLAAFAEKEIPTILSGFALAEDAFHAPNESYRLVPNRREAMREEPASDDRRPHQGSGIVDDVAYPDVLNVYVSRQLAVENAPFSIFFASGNIEFCIGQPIDHNAVANTSVLVFLLEPDRR